MAMLVSMTNPFAAIETTLNTGALAAVRNATLAWGGHSAGGVFGIEYVDTFGMANRAPSFRCVAADLPGMAQGQAVSVDYADTVVNYTVREVRQDGTGLLQLILEAA